MKFKVTGGHVINLNAFIKIYIILNLGKNHELWLMNFYNYVDNDPGHDYDRDADNDINENNNE